MEMLAGCYTVTKEEHLTNHHGMGEGRERSLEEKQRVTHQKLLFQAEENKKTSLKKPESYWLLNYDWEFKPF